MYKEVKKQYPKLNEYFSLNIPPFCIFLLFYSVFTSIHALSRVVVFMQLSNFTLFLHSITPKWG